MILKRETVVKFLKELYELGLISKLQLYKLSHKSIFTDDDPVITLEEYATIIGGK